MHGLYLQSTPRPANVSMLSPLFIHYLVQIILEIVNWFCLEHKRIYSKTCVKTATLNKTENWFSRPIIV